MSTIAYLLMIAALHLPHDKDSKAPQHVSVHTKKILEPEEDEMYNLLDIPQGMKLVEQIPNRR